MGSVEGWTGPWFWQCCLRIHIRGVSTLCCLSACAEEPAELIDKEDRSLDQENIREGDILFYELGSVPQGGLIELRVSHYVPEPFEPNSIFAEVSASFFLFVWVGGVFSHTPLRLDLRDAGRVGKNQCGALSDDDWDTQLVVMANPTIVELPATATLLDLKSLVLREVPTLQGMDVPATSIRVREVEEGGLRLGKVFRENDKMLRRQGVGNQMFLSVQVCVCSTFCPCGVRKRSVGAVVLGCTSLGTTEPVVLELRSQFFLLHDLKQFGTTATTTSHRLLETVRRTFLWTVFWFSASSVTRWPRSGSYLER